MSNLGKRLSALGITRILIADDTPTNLDAARELIKQLPEIKLEFFASKQEVTKAILDRPHDIGLVITDLKMGTPDAGLDIYGLSMSLGIPAIIVTNYDHQGTKTMVESLLVRGQIWEGKKNTPELWMNVLKLFADAADPHTSHEDYDSHLTLKACRIMAETGGYSETDRYNRGQMMRGFAARNLGLA